MRLALSDSESDSGSESGQSSRSRSSRRSQSHSQTADLDEDASESGSDDMPPVNRLQDSESEASASDTDESMQEPPKRSGKERQTSVVPSSPSISPSPEPTFLSAPKPNPRQSLAQLSGQDQFRNKVMQASLFQSRQPQPQGPSRSTPGPLANSQKAILPPPSAGLLTEVEEPQEPIEDLHVAPKLPGRAPRAPKKLQRVSESHTVVKSSSADPCLRQTRSLAAAWGPDGMLVRPSLDLLNEPSVVLHGATCNISPATSSSLDKLLSVKLAHTTFTPDERGIPQASALPTLRFSHFETSGVHEDVFSLGRTLFDPLGLTGLPQDPTQINTICAHARRASLLSWWTQHTSTAVEKAFKEAPTALEGTFALLTGFQIERAADSAMDLHDFRLATLIAQAGTADADFKTDLHNQLQKWEHLDVSKLVDKSYKAILSLLSGHAPPSNLDWQRRLACTLFYGSPDLASALSDYVPSEQASEDYSFELIRLACRLSPALEHTLLPAHFPGSSAVERECQAWICHQLLAKVHRFTDFEEPESSACQLVVSLAAGLEQAGLWHWAVFVLLHLQTSESREKTIKDVLCRHATQFDDATVSALRSYDIPSTWIAEAQARLYLSEESCFAAAHAFVEADMLSEAHQITVWELAPEAVLVGDMELLDELLQPFVGRELRVDWSEGGQFFQTYASAVRLQSNLRHGLTEQITALRQALPKMLAALPTFLLKAGETRRPLVREAAVSQMLDVCTRLWGLLDPSELGDVGVDGKDMSDPVDYVASLSSSGFEQALKQVMV